MRQPPAPYNRYRTAEQRRQEKAARRAVIVQCDRCQCNGTATVNSWGRLVSTNVATARPRPGQFFHADCGGRLIAFDIEVDA